MKVAILENDHKTVEKLEDLLGKINRSIEIVCKMESIQESLSWSDNHTNPDLFFISTTIFEESSFEIVKLKANNTPIIFLSSNTEFVLQCFKLNCVYYLLKPLQKEELQFSLQKFNSIYQKGAHSFDPPMPMSKTEIPYKSRFLIKYGDTLLFKGVDEIAYFYADEKVVQLVSQDGRKYLIDHNLESIEKQMDPLVFYRINRKMIVTLSSIQKIKSLFNNRLQVFLKPGFEKEVYISKEKSSAFKNWLDI